MSPRRVGPEDPPEEEPPLFAAPKPEAVYRFPSGSTLHIGGLDKPARLFSTQPPLITPALARQNDPDTSHAAARSLDGKPVARMAQLVYRAIKASGANGATGWEMAASTGLERDSITPRIPRLVELGLVVDSGARRAVRGKRSETVWAATEKDPGFSA